MTDMDRTRRTDNDLVPEYAEAARYFQALDVLKAQLSRALAEGCPAVAKMPAAHQAALHSELYWIATTFALVTRDLPT